MNIENEITLGVISAGSPQYFIFAIIILEKREKNRVFRRYHAGSNPVNWIDPRGLAKWKGVVAVKNISSGWRFLAGGGIYGQLESECVNNKKAKVSFVGLLGGASFSADTWRKVPLPTKYLTHSVGFAEMETPGDPDPDDFYGAISLLSASFVFGGGYSLLRRT